MSKPYYDHAGITLTIAEIFDLAKAVNIIPHKAKLDELLESDAETEYTITTKEGGLIIWDEDGKNPKLYASGACLAEYPEEGMFPLGNELPSSTPKGE